MKLSNEVHRLAEDTARLENKLKEYETVISELMLARDTKHFYNMAVAINKLYDLRNDVDRQGI